MGRPSKAASGAALGKQVYKHPVPRLPLSKEKSVREVKPLLHLMKDSARQDLLRIWASFGMQYPFTPVRDLDQRPHRAVLSLQTPPERIPAGASALGQGVYCESIYFPIFVMAELPAL